MPAVAPAPPQPERPQGERKIIRDHQDLLRSERKFFSDFPDRDAAVVHDTSSGRSAPRPLHRVGFRPVILTASLTQGTGPASAEFVQHHEPDIVPGVPVGPAMVAEPDHEQVLHVFPAPGLRSGLAFFLFLVGAASPSSGFLPLPTTSGSAAAAAVAAASSAVGSTSFSTFGGMTADDRAAQRFGDRHVRQIQIAHVDEVVDVHVADR